MVKNFKHFVLDETEKTEEFVHRSREYAWQAISGVEYVIGCVSIGKRGTFHGVPVEL